MASIESHITIDLEDGEDSQQVIDSIRKVISSFNGKETRVNVIEMDNPLTTSPIKE